MMYHAFALAFAAIVLTASPVAHSEGPSADQLYDRFREARISIAKLGPAATLDLYSRGWLEYALQSAFKAGDRPRGPIDYIQDSLWSKFQGIGIVDSVYDYRLLSDASGHPSLELRITTNVCRQPDTEHPALLTLVFEDEGGTWRVATEKTSVLAKDVAWYKSTLIPRQRFPYFEPLDRTPSWHEWAHDAGIQLPSRCKPTSEVVP